MMNVALRHTSKGSFLRGTRSIAALAFRNAGVKNTLPANLSGVYISRRFNSNEVDKNAPSNVDSTGNTPIDLNPLFDGNAIDAATAVVVQTAPEVNFVLQSIMSGIDMIHMNLGVPYWGSICIATIGIRLCLLPVAYKTIRGGAQMAVMRPEMQKLQDAMNSDPNKSDPRHQARHMQEMKALWKKYDVNPVRAMMWPLFQFPIFIAFFMALRDMGAHYTGYATGGALWFTDLSGPDSTLILPIFNSLSFLAMIELGADGVQVSQQKTFQWAMRGLAVAMVPLTMSMPQGLFVYWCTNNVLSLLQTTLLKNKKIKKFLDIPDVPKPENTPVLKMVNPINVISEAFEKERAVKSNVKAEILQSAKAVPAAPTIPADVTPPTSFAMPPRQSRRPQIKK